MYLHRGHVPALTNLGTYYALGHGVTGDFAQAGGFLRTSTRPTSNLLLLLRTTVWDTSIHPESTH